jgi:hypothetical protein
MCRAWAQGARAKRESLAQVPKRGDFVVSYVIEFVDRPGRPLMSVERCVCLFCLFGCLFCLVVCSVWLFVYLFICSVCLFVCLFVWSYAVVLFVAGPLILVGYARTGTFRACSRSTRTTSAVRFVLLFVCLFV